MKQIISEDRAIYEDMYHGQFSQRLAKWAISRMRRRDPQTGAMRPIAEIPVENVLKLMKDYGVNISDQYIYTAWYLYHMALADYPKALQTDDQRVKYVEETLTDPDGDPSDVLECFVAKMCNAGVPIYWERMV